MATLALNSTEPDAFSPWDVEVLQQVAAVLAEGFARIDDLAAQEERQRQLTEEVEAHRRAEDDLRTAEQRYRTLFEEAPEMNGLAKQ